jgi:hypothetical protein
MLRLKPKLQRRRRRPRGKQARSNWSEPESRRSGLRMVLSPKSRSRTCAFIQFSGLRRSISRRSSALLVDRNEGWLDIDAHIVLCSSAKSASTSCESLDASRLLQIIIRCQHISRSEHEFRYQLPYLPISIPLTRKLAVSVVGLFSIQRGELLKAFVYLMHRFLSYVAAQAEKFSPASISCANRIHVSHSILESLFADPDVSQRTHVPMIGL